MTSQITKDFQMKSKLRKLADGGSPDPSMLGTGAAAHAGVLLAGRGRQIDDAVNAATGGAPVPAPQRAPEAPKKSMLRSLLGLADGGSYFDAGYNANRYQQSQLMDGGRVNGPGGRTDDKVGPVMLSDKEYVLPGDTADAIGRDKLDKIRLATHEFKDGRKESALRGRADGGDYLDDLLPMDHLADGGNPWIVDSDGVARRANAFGDAAAGPGYQQPRALPPPKPNYAVGPSNISPATGPRTINMGMVDEVPRQSPLRVTGPAATSGVTAPAEAAAAAPAPAAPAAPQGRAYQVGKAIGGVAGTAGRIAGGVATTAPLAGFGDYKADTGGIDTSAGGTLGYLAKGEFGKAGASLSGGAGEALADSGRGIAKTADWVAGLVGAKPNLTGKYDSMVADKLGGYLSLRNPEAPVPPKGAVPPPVPAGTPSALRSEQGPALPVQPGSYQSRRLSEMGVPANVQNSNPAVDINLRTDGTSQYQNLGSYGGNGSIYGKADDPSRPERINNFAGVGAGASPANEANGSGLYGGAIQSALRGLGGGSMAPGGPASNGGNNVTVIGDSEGRYDKLAKDLRGMYSAKGQGNLAKKLVELEQLRSNEQGNIRSNETSRANAQLNADTLRSNALLNAATSLAESQARIDSANALKISDQRIAMLRYNRENQQYADQRQDKGLEQTNKAISAAFTSTGSGDKARMDAGAVSRFNEYLGSGKVMYQGRPFLSLNPQERDAALPDVINAFKNNEAMNAGGGVWGGTRTSNSPSALRVRNPEIGDLANGLGIGEYLGAKFVPGYDSHVVERAGDRKVRSVEQTAGNDLERKKAILRNLATGD